MSHTPGQWTFEGGRILGGGGAIAKMVNQSANYRAQSDADGHLIAAAPELLMALEAAFVAGSLALGQMTEGATGHRELLRALAHARELIAKARGQ